MIRFSFSSFYMSLLFANIMILFLYLIFRNQKLMMRFGVPMLGTVLCVTILRMLIPVELLFISHNILLPGFFSGFLSEFVHPRFFDGRFSLWTFFVFIWLCGILFSAFRCFQEERDLSRIIQKDSKPLPENSPARSALQRIQQEFPKTCRIDVRIMPALQVPMIYGLHHPRILLPETIELNQTQLYYILRHEAAHFLHHDLLLKLGVRFFCVVYWWNPFCKVLREQAEAILEMRVDQSIAKQPDQKTEYLECLLSVARYAVPDSSVSAANALSFCSNPSQLLNRRFYMLLDDDVQPFHRILKNTGMAFIFSLFLLSFLFIFEASTIHPDDTIDSVLPNENNSYFIQREDGRYDFYLNREYVETIDTIDYYENVPIYKNP